MLDASSWRVTRSGTRESTVSTFQLSGRCPATDISVNRSISSSLNWSRQPSTIASSVVPSCSLTAPQSASTSSWLAHRDATGFPSPSECVYESVVEKPSPPASIDSVQLRHHRGDLGLGRFALDRLGAHHVAPDRAVPDEEPGVDARRCPRARRGTRRRSPSSTARRSRARPGACPRPAPSSGGGSRRPRRAPAPA